MNWRKIILSGTALTVSGAMSLSAAVINVFLVGGQSNTDGRADSRELPAELKWQEEVIFFANSADNKLTCLHPWVSPNGQGIFQFGPEITFGRELAEHYLAKGERVAILKHANGGTNLHEQWRADGTASADGDGKIYQAFQVTINRGLEALKKSFPNDTLTVRGMIWMQGESDADTKQNDAEGGKYSLEYGKNLAELIKDARLTFSGDLRFVIGKLSSKQKNTGKEEYRDNVRAGQERTAKEVPMTGIISTDEFSLKPDQLHFDAAGQQAMGRAFAKEMLRLLAE
ncbi:MAG: sialate O-acetylesterase [Verrucomicrobiales bacterium]|jgi:hypothetical protein|nr:sialate O-acetylesterase [Verrucomicrobiales bacterium]